MKSNLKEVSIIMLVSIIFSGLLLYYNFNDVIIPSWSAQGVDLYVYVITAFVFISIVLKFIIGIFGITAMLKDTPEDEKQKKLRISGKLAVPVVACGIVCLMMKLFYGASFTVVDVFDIALDIILGIIFIICSMYVRAGRE